MRRTRFDAVALVFAGLVAALILPSVRAEGRPLVPEDYYRLITVQAPAISPDGRWVAFVRAAIVEAENRRQNELWIASTDGSSAPRRLSDPALNVSNPRWSPDGQLLAFAGRRRDI